MTGFLHPTGPTAPLMTPRSGQFRVRPAGRTRSMIRTRPIFTGQVRAFACPTASGLAAQPLLGRPPEAERAFAWPSGWVASTPLPPSWGPPGRRSAKPSPGTAGHACPQPRAVRQWAIVAGCRVVRLESHFLRQLCAVSIGSEGISVHAWRCSDARGQGWLWSLARRLMNATRAA
jgi:hypothetical protein